MENFLQMLHQAGHWICHRQLWASSWGCVSSSPGKGNSDQTSRLWPSFQTEPILSNAEQSLHKSSIVFQCFLHTEITHDLPLSRFSLDHEILEQPVQSPILQRKTLMAKEVKRFARSPTASRWQRSSSIMLDSYPLLSSLPTRMQFML